MYSCYNFLVCMWERLWKFVGTSQLLSLSFLAHHVGGEDSCVESAVKKRWPEPCTEWHDDDGHWRYDETLNYRARDSGHNIVSVNCHATNSVVLPVRSTVIRRRSATLSWCNKLWKIFRRSPLNFRPLQLGYPMLQRCVALSVCHTPADFNECHNQWPRMTLKGNYAYTSTQPS